MNTDTDNKTASAQPENVRIDRVKIKWAQDETYGDEILECVQAIAEVSYSISGNGDRRVEWLTSCGLYCIDNSDAFRNKSQFESEQIADLASHLNRFGISCSEDLLKTKINP